MTGSLPKYVRADEAAALLARLGDEFAVVENPGYVFPRHDLYPLAPKRATVDGRLAGVVMDMDGTTTTTEPLCIHALETMVRRVTGNAENPAWPGLDRDRDYPHIIGNSTTRHIEYLLDAYADALDPRALHRWYLHAAVWTLGQAADAGRRREAAATMNALGIGALAQDPRFTALAKAGRLDGPEEQNTLDVLCAETGDVFRANRPDSRVRAAIDIYYQRYHEMLAAIAAGRGDAVARDVLGTGAHLIEPMPGIGLFLALVKGWLGADFEACAPALLAEDRSGEEAPAPGVLAALGRHFEANPAKVAVVTSSIAYEADIVLGEVFRLLAGGVADWPVAGERRQVIAGAFADPRTFYDGIVTASDSSEIRLKPHRDLYGLALHRLGLRPSQFGQVAGFEDSESGTIAIRAAGISVCCALPFAMTRGHGFEAASHVCAGGIPEVILRHGVFLPDTPAEGD